MKEITSLTKSERKDLGLTKRLCKHLERVRCLLFANIGDRLRLKDYKSLQVLMTEGLIRFEIQAPAYDLPLEKVIVHTCAEHLDFFDKLAELDMWIHDQPRDKDDE